VRPRLASAPDARRPCQVSDGQAGEDFTLEEAYGAAPPYGGPVTRAEAREGADPDAVDPDGVDVEAELLVAAGGDHPEGDAEEALNGAVNGFDGNGSSALVTFTEPEAGTASPKSALKGGVSYAPYHTSEVRTLVSSK
jgi:hypothetical protein